MTNLKAGSAKEKKKVDQLAALLIELDMPISLSLRRKISKKQKQLSK